MKLRVSLSLLAASAGLAFAGPHAAPPDGPVAGAPFLVVSDHADATHCGGHDVRVRALEGRGNGGELELVAAMTIDSPRGLDFDPAHKAAVQASQKRFSDWFTDATKKMGAARDVYMARFTDAKATPTDKTAAIARIVQLDRRFADVISYMEIPRSVRSGQFAADATQAFCDALDEKAKPLDDKADADAATCRQAAIDGKVGAG